MSSSKATDDKAAPKHLSAHSKTTQILSLIGLIVASFAVSSAAVFFKLLPDISFLTKSYWRLLLTACLQSLILITLIIRDGFNKTSFLLLLQHYKLIILDGLMLALHFAWWVWSLDLTSVTRSLLLVSSSPVIIVLYNVVKRRPLHGFEIIGAIVSALGVGIMCFGMEEGSGGSLAGDGLAFLASIAIVVYMEIGRKLRSEFGIPAYYFITPVHYIAAFITLLLAMCFAQESGFVLFLGFLEQKYFPIVLVLAIGPGILGHTMVNVLLKYVPPLVVSVFLNLEPVWGTILAIAMGMDSGLTLFTLVGGTVMLGGIMFVLYGGALREREEHLTIEEREPLLTEKPTAQ